MGYNRKIGVLIRGTDMGAEFGISLADIIRHACEDSDSFRLPR